jgi:quercetin dioxygenase-like cupin family protein
VTQHPKSHFSTHTGLGAIGMGFLVAASLSSAPAFATPASGFTAVQQWKGVYPALNINTGSDRKYDKDDKWDLKLMSKDVSDVYVTRNAIAPGGQSGWHTHPGPSLVTVAVGEVTVYEGDNPLCTGKVYKAGEGSIDLGGGHLHLIKNESGAPAETVAVQFVPQGATRRIDAPAPNNCNF